MKKLYKIIKDIIILYNEKEIAGMSARLSYYMLFTFFPVMLFGSTVLAGLLPQEFRLPTANLIPYPVRRFAYSYIGEIRDEISGRVLFLAAVLTFYSLTKYVNSYRTALREIYGVPERGGFIADWITSFLFSLMLFLLFLLAVVAVFLTDNILDILGLDFLSDSLWFTLRFFAVAIYAFFVLSLINRAEYGNGVRLRDFYPGSALAVSVWIIISALFSYYAGEIADYSVLYGSIGNVIMLLVWLNMTNTILLLCAALNIFLKEKC